MLIDNFNYDIPDHLIAQNPSNKRSDSKLLVYYKDKDIIVDSQVKNITDFIDSSNFMVFNNSKVMPSRLKIMKSDNNREGELLVLKIVDSSTIIGLTDKSKKYKPGSVILLPGNVRCVVKEDIDSVNKMIVADEPVFTYGYFEANGMLPLPPYIRKTPGTSDYERYQTVYSKEYGSAAAPTAGLHFDDDVFASLKSKSIDYTFVSLHVGLGTFMPIYTDNIEDHKIHEEEFSVSTESARLINEALKNGKKIIPVGTTSLRTLESAFVDGGIAAGDRKTSLYIYPGYKFKIASGIFTNFHTPKSSLAVLVSTFTGVDKLREIYDYAVQKEYRFFSYGDAMLII